MKDSAGLLLVLWDIPKLATALLMGGLLICGPSNAMEAGFQIEKIIDTSRNRPILVDLWYPVTDRTAEPYDYGLGKGKVVEAGAIASGTFPLILLSHGAMGAARNYSWIAEELARAGYIVAGVSHFGESYAHGPETVDPTAVLRTWERPLDVMAVVSHMASTSKLTGSVDLARIGFVGHSSGGATGLVLAGGVFDARKIAEYCNSHDSVGDKGCDYGAAASSDPDPDARLVSHADERIQVFVLLDPALGPGFTDFSAVDPINRVLIVGSVDNDFLPFPHHAELIAERLSKSDTHWLTEGEGHFVYLNTCELKIKANGVPLCLDRPGVTRDRVQKKLKVVIGDYFDGGLKHNPQG